jgi:hypothetical protein
LVCERTYRRFTLDGYLVEGLPPQYGYGGGDVVRALVEKTARAGALVAEIEQAGRGDIDRLMTEWRSLLRQIAHAPALAFEKSPHRTADGSRQGVDAAYLAERWDNFRALCRVHLGEDRPQALPDLPPLTADQRRPVQHRFFRGASAMKR